MKKYAIIMLTISLVCFTVLLSVGLVAAHKGVESPVIQQPTRPAIEFIPPVSNVSGNLQQGTYYLIASTNQSYYLQKTDIQSTIEKCPRLEFFKNGLCTLWYRGNHEATYTEKEGVVQFTPADFMLTQFPFVIEHTDEWYENAQQDIQYSEDFECIYDATANAIHMRYHEESMTFMFFETDEHATKWFMQYLPDEGGMVLPNYVFEYTTTH